MDKHQLKDYDSALDLIRSQRPIQQTEQRELNQCLNHIVAEDVFAQVDSPPFTNSAMDGFAFAFEDGNLGPLHITGTIAAQIKPTIPDHRVGACVRIMTGAVMPEWADTVIPIEFTEETDSQVAFKKPVEKGANVRHQGEDIKKGQLLFREGITLDAERIMVAAAFGHSSLKVYQFPKIFLISTGDELSEPGTPLEHGMIYNSSKYFLHQAIKKMGFSVCESLTLGDNEDRAAAQIDNQIDTKTPCLILTTGAVSAGDKDFIPGLAKRLGFDEIFHKVAIRPGKPVYLAKKDETYWLGLPGNAISTCVGWHFFAKPLLQTLAQVPEQTKRTVTLQNKVTKPEHLHCFYRAELNMKNDKAWVAPAQQSARLAATINANAYVELPAGQKVVPAGTSLSATLIE